jgi:hypothetical protein
MNQMEQFERQAKINLLRREKMWDISMNQAEPAFPHIYIDFAKHGRE